MSATTTSTAVVLEPAAWVSVPASVGDVHARIVRPRGAVASAIAVLRQALHTA